jgi:hypothetical protein
MTTPGPSTSTPIVFTPIATVPLPRLPDTVEIYDGMGPLHLTALIASSETDEYTYEFVRIGPLGIKLWLTRKSDDRLVRTLIFRERDLLLTLANMALDSLKVHPPTEE